ncbi:MAG TPA: hypothetical protein VNY05_43760 [Candidatus Acidoferrales bacterium]|jgi:hypothetical protein|nr:hypothetical protein [Candidatus Acidoferrales bacterium]
MTTTKIALFAGAAAIVAGGLVLGIRMNPSTSTNDGHGTIAAPAGVAAVKQGGQPDQVNPFTNVASIPATVDPSTIRFEKLRMVELASKTKTTTDAQDCKERQFRDPDGSNCQTTNVVERVKALAATYSFNGPAVSSGEATPGRDTFSVYFRPEEVGVDGPVQKLKRDQAASYFQISTHRAMVQQEVIDKAHSNFCEGSYVDGSWVHKDAKCQDQVQYTNQSVPSPYLTVQVDLRPPVATK